MSVASSLTVYRAPGNNTGVGQVVVQADENGLAVSSPGSLQANSNIIPEFLEIALPFSATSVTSFLWMVTSGRWQVQSVTAYFQTGTGAGGTTLNFSADSGTQAPGAGTAILSANISLVAASQQIVANGVLASPNPVLGPGDRLSSEFGGTLTSLANGMAVIRMRRLS